MIYFVCLFPHSTVMSPEGEIYGFGAKFKENSQQYFDMSASYPSGVGGDSVSSGRSTMKMEDNVENQKFLDALSTKLLGKTSGIPKSNGSPSRNAGESMMLSNNIGSKADLNAEIQNGTFQLRKTNGIQNDCSAPKF